MIAICRAATPARLDRHGTSARHRHATVLRQHRARRFRIAALNGGSTMATTALATKTDIQRARRQMVLMKAKTLLDTIERDGRAPTADEERQHAAYLAEIDGIDKQLAQAA